MIILIPAYKPDNSMVLLCKKLLMRVTATNSRLEILLVDDGSGVQYQEFFQAASMQSPRIHVLTLEQNGGKGAALRAGFEWCVANRPGSCVVTADADGQHLPADILAVGVATELRKHQRRSALVLGVRTIEDPLAPEPVKVPWRSRIGNAATVAFFRLATGQKVVDTQTGLRGLTPDVVHWALSIPGNRYEYEFTMLLRASKANMLLEQVAITKVYEPGNPTSHFKPVRDSLRIYAPLLGFLATSLAGFGIDTLALLGLVGLGVHVVPAVILARTISALCNFVLNKVVLHDGGTQPSAKTSLARYAVLAVGILATNASLMAALTWAGLPLIVAKVIVEATLVPISFAVQKRWVFRSRSASFQPAATELATPYESARRQLVKV